jgi:hypothetical protein
MSNDQVMDHVECLVELWVTPNPAEVRRQLKSAAKFESLMKLREKNADVSNARESKRRKDQAET